VEEDMHILVDIEYIKGEIRLPNFVYPSSEEDLMVQVVLKKIYVLHTNQHHG